MAARPGVREAAGRPLQAERWSCAPRPFLCADARCDVFAALPVRSQYAVCTVTPVSRGHTPFRPDQPRFGSLALKRGLLSHSLPLPLLHPHGTQ